MALSRSNASTEDLGWHTCTSAELGLDTTSVGQARFFEPVYQGTRAKLTKHAGQMRCFDEPINLKGSSEADEFEQFVIRFVYCDASQPGLNCLPRDQAELKMRGKAVLLLSN